MGAVVGGVPHCHLTLSIPHTDTMSLSFGSEVVFFSPPPLEPAIEGQNDNIHNCYHEAVMDVNLQPIGQVHLHLLPHLFVVCQVSAIIT